mgnify:CR=1 FL=1
MTARRLTPFELEEIAKQQKVSKNFIGLVEPVCKDLPFGVGSMGFALPAACGFAWSKKEKKERGRIFVLESDGGFHEGSSWEAIMFAAQHKLDNLICILDANKFCAMGKTVEVLNQKYLKKVLEEMGWLVSEIDGHNFNEIEKALLFPHEKPHLIIAHTIKGKGIDFMEGSNLWHYAQIKEDDYQKALQCLK